MLSRLGKSRFAYRRESSFRDYAEVSDVVENPYRNRRLYGAFLSSGIFCFKLIIQSTSSISLSQTHLLIHTMFSTNLYTLVFLATGIAVEAVPAP